MYRILIVDDEQLERKALRYLVEKNMPELEVVGEAMSGDDAVELAREHKPQIILMDIKMPGKSGLEAAQEINRFNLETKIIILTAFDYFDYAQTALQIGVVDYLLKPIRPRELFKVLQNCINDLNDKENQDAENKRNKEQLTKLWPYIESSFVYDLINGNIIDEEDLKQRTSILGINLLPAIVMILGIEDDVDTETSITEFQYQLKRQRVFEVIQDIFADNNKILINPIMAHKFVVLVPFVSTTVVETHYKYCQIKGKEIIEKLTEEGIVVSIGIGNYYEDTGMIRQSYLEALAAQRGASFAGGSEVISCFDCKQKESFQLSVYKYQKEAELLDLMYAADWNGATKKLEFLWNNIRSSNLGEELKKACVLELLIVLYRAVVISESDTITMAVLNLSTIRKILDCNTIDQLGDYFYQAADEIMDIFKNENTDILSAAKMTKHFIDTNFSKDITLKDASSYIHMSSCYLSRIFSRELGLPFKKYLVKVRLNYARKLLLSTNKSIGEIASEVGYQDTSYFCRIFKQDEGLSPNEFRAKNKQESGSSEL